MRVRQEQAEDVGAVHALNRAAFGGDVEARLVDALRDSDAFVPELSIVAELGGAVVGHLLLTRAAVVSDSSRTPALALAPMCVAPERQRRGIGAMLVREGLRRAEGLGHAVVVVVGHPAYYPRFGFERASDYGVRVAFEAPDEAVMLRRLGGAPAPRGGVVEYAGPIMRLVADQG